MLGFWLMLFIIKLHSRKDIFKHLKTVFLQFSILAINTNIMNKTIKNFLHQLLKIPLISKKPTCRKTSEMECDSKTKWNKRKKS